MKKNNSNTTSLIFLQAKIVLSIWLLIVQQTFLPSNLNREKGRFFLFDKDS